MHLAATLRGDALDPASFVGEEAPREMIEPGAGPALAAFTIPELSPGERLLRFAYRAGVPAAALQSPFRRPRRPRLLATVASPLPGDAAAGAALRSGHFLFNGAKVAIPDLDFTGGRLPPQVRRVVHGFSWLDDLAASGPREACSPVAERIFALWLQANPRPGRGDAWSVGLAGHRLLAWLIHAPLLLSGKDKALRAWVLRTMLETARWLDRHVARADDRLGEVGGWCAIAAAGLLLADGKPRRLYGEAGLMRALGELIGDDGGVLSRSPRDQMEAIDLLVRLVACYRATRREPPEAVGRVLAVLVPPLLAVLHGDGSLASWQGCAPLDARRIDALLAASGVRARPLKDARQWGYQRVGAGPAVLLFDAAPPPAARHARDGCASTLAFEFSHGPERIVVNCGGAAFTGGLIPSRLAQGLRATAAHSTLVLDDSNSTAVLIKGRLGSGVSEVRVDRRAVTTEAGEATRLEASHDGYAARHGLVHRRVLILRDDGGALLGQDLLEPAGRRPRRANVPFAIRFHLSAGVEPVLDDDGGSALLALADGSVWRFASPDTPLAIEDSLWVDAFGRPVGTRQLVLQGLAPRGGGAWSWLLERIGDRP